MKKYQRKERKSKQKGLFCGATVQTPRQIGFVTLPSLFIFRINQLIGVLAFQGLHPQQQLFAANKCFQPVS